MSSEYLATRKLESSIRRDLGGQMTYDEYLCLDQLLDAQRPKKQPPHHDELLFIIQHQTTELWMKLILHELKSAIDHLRGDHVDPCFKILSRVRLIQRQLFDQWAILETLTPSEYSEFRAVLGHASGLQSAQYRSIEFILGNKQRDMLDLFRHDAHAYETLKAILEAPGLYDEFLRYLHRKGFSVPAALVDRDWSLPHERTPALVPVLKSIYEAPREHWDAYELCEKLVDLEEQFQLWRFRHLKTVERIIGYKHGTGGSSGVAFLKKALEITFFPELFDVRTEIGTTD